MELENINPKTNRSVYFSDNIYNESELMDDLKKQLPEVDFDIKHRHVYVSGNLESENGKYLQRHRLHFSPRVQAILGLTGFTTTFSKDNIILGGWYPIYFNYGQTKMMIYSDLVKPSFVGGGQHPLLRMSKYDGEVGVLQVKEFATPHYISTRQSIIDSIRVYILSESGDTLPLSTGDVSLTLHFRKKR